VEEAAMSAGFAIAMGECIVCKRLFSFNPVRVPSTVAMTGKREPICEGCITLVNAGRRKNGLPEWPIFPDSYEPVEESEL
jgi:hypothetical protein